MGKVSDFIWYAKTQLQCSELPSDVWKKKVQFRTKQIPKLMKNEMDFHKRAR
jgi:hypothetical protein